MAARLKRPPRGERKDVDAGAVTAKYKSWLRRQPLADRSREAYLALEERLHQAQDFSVHDLRSHAAQQGGVVDLVERVGDTLPTSGTSQQRPR